MHFCVIITRPGPAADIGNADIINGDHSDFVTGSQIAQKMFEVPRVIARVMDPARAEWYSGQGLSTICPTRYAVEMFEQELAGV